MRNIPDTLMLFAAGLGTRMGELTKHVPKPLIQVGGRALIDHALDQAEAAHIERIVVNLHYKADQIRAHFSNHRKLLFSDETDSILETGGGLKRALPLLQSEAVLTLNTDAVWTGKNALEELQSAWEPDRMSALLLLIPKSRALGHSGAGDFELTAEGRLERGGPYIYSGAQIVTTDELSQIDEPVFSLNRLWDLLLANGRAFGIVHDGGWCDVGRPDCIPVAEALLTRSGSDV